MLDGDDSNMIFTRKFGKFPGPGTTSDVAAPSRDLLRSGTRVGMYVPMTS